MFGGMVLDRPERMGFKPKDAIAQMEVSNLKNKDNRYFEQFKKFENVMQGMRDNMGESTFEKAKHSTQNYSIETAIRNSGKIQSNVINILEKRKQRESLNPMFSFEVLQGMGIKREESGKYVMIDKTEEIGLER